MIPSSRLWVSACLLALPALAAGFVDGLWPPILAADLLLGALALGDLVLARGTPLAARRRLPPRLQVGVPGQVEVELRNPGRRPVRVSVKDDLPDELTASPEVLELTVPARSRARAHYAATPASRGRFGFGALHLRVHGPLGLVAHERVVPAAELASVFPDMRGASRLLLADAALDLVNLGLRRLRRDGRGSEFARLRDYAQGDSVREVDWKATARRSRPVTRVMEAERSQSVLIAVDAGRSMAARVDGLTRLDHAVNAALFLAFVALRNGDRVGLVTFADGVKTWLQPAAGRAQYRRLLDALCTTTPQLAWVDTSALFRELNARLPRRTLLCLFTDFSDEDQALAMVDPLRRLARRHLPLCLSAKDPALAGLLSSPPGDPEAAFQHAAASELLLEREAVKRRVGRDGVTVLDVEASALSLTAVNTYLELKARGSL